MAAGDLTVFNEAKGFLLDGGFEAADVIKVALVSGGTATFDSATNPTWAQNASNPTNARYAIIYNDTDASDRAIAFVDLGSTIDMTVGSLTLTWNASGLFTVT